MSRDLQKEALLELAHYRMPFGKYQDRYPTALPESYLVWFRQTGFPDGNLGALLAATMEFKENGSEDMNLTIHKEFPK